jgi:hypothetical protein
VAQHREHPRKKEGKGMSFVEYNSSPLWTQVFSDVDDMRIWVENYREQLCEQVNEDLEEKAHLLLKDIEPVLQWQMEILNPGEVVIIASLYFRYPSELTVVT